MTPSDQKAREILEAASAVLAEQGFAKTTISQVAARAGVSRGLLHYYFKSKEEMLAQVVRSHVDTTTQLVEMLFVQSDDVRELANALVVGLRQLLESSPEFFHLLFEAWVIARQSELVAKELRTMYQRFRQAMQAGLANAIERGMIPSTRPLEGLAVLLTSIIDGLGLQLVAEPELGDNNLIWEETRSAIEMALSNRTA